MASEDAVLQMPVPIIFEISSAEALAMPTSGAGWWFEASMNFRESHAGAHQRLAAIAHVDCTCNVGGGVRTQKQC